MVVSAMCRVFREASTSPGFGQYDGRTYSARWAARITGQLLVERTNTFTFELDNREGAKLYLDGRLCIDNDWNVRDTGATAAVVSADGGRVVTAAASPFSTFGSFVSKPIRTV